MFGLTAAAIAAASMLYSLLLVFALTHTPDLVLLLMPAAGFLIAVAMGAQGAGNVVFGGRDNDLLLSLPIPRTMLAGAKLGALLVENVLTMVCITVPAGLASTLVAPVAGWFWPALVAVAALLGCLATTASALIGLLLTLLRSRRHGKLITNVLAMGMMLGMVALWLGSQTFFRTMLDGDPGALRATLAAWLPPFEWARAALVQPTAQAWGLLLVSALLPPAALAWIVGRAFVGLTSALTVRSGPRRATSLDALRARTPFAALVRRERQRFFGTTVYFVNAGFGLVLVALGAGYLLVARDVPELTTAAGLLGLAPAHLLAVAFAMVMSTFLPTSASISLEGRRLWILREIPVPTATILAAKAAFPLVLAAPVLVFATVGVAVAAAPTPVETALVFAVPLAACAFGAGLGLVDNLQWPNLDAASETAAVKQGASVVVTLFGAMIGTGLAVGLGLAVGALTGSTVGLLVTLGVLVAATGACVAALRTWGVRAFAELD